MQNDFTPEELRVWYDPRTWFRRKLVLRTAEEMTPQLRGIIDEVILLEMPNIERLFREGKLAQEKYDSKAAYLRKKLGNALYR
jgi:hypothetical protein